MKVVYSDNKITITDNARVLDTSGVMRNEYVDVASLAKTNHNHILMIVGKRTGANVGTYNMQTNQVNYLPVADNGNSNGGINLGTNNVIGDVSTGAVTLESIMGGNVNNQQPQQQANIQVQTADAPKVDEPEEEQFDYIEGYRFLPIPTTYTRVVLDKISKTTAKYKIKVKVDEMSKHDEIYKSLKTSASGKDFVVAEVLDSEIAIASNFETFAYMSTEGKGDIAALASLLLTGFYIKSTKVKDVATYKNMPFTTILPDSNIAVTNVLLKIASNSSDLFTWLEIANKELDLIQKASLRRYILDLLLDNLTSIANELILDDTFDPFENPYYLRHLIDDGIDDIIAKGKYEEGFTRCYKRLTHIENIKAYNDVIMTMVDDTNEHIVYELGGIKENTPMIVCRDIEVDTELNRLVTVLSRSEFYKVHENTPNTAKLLKAILANNVSTTSGKAFNLLDYSTVGNNSIYFLVRSNLFKVIKTEDEGILIRRML